MATLRVKAGIATSPTLQQSQFRLGGLATVRGFEYGTRAGVRRSGPRSWTSSPLKGRLRPVAFVDAGQAARPGDLFSSRRSRVPAWACRCSTGRFASI